MYRRSECRRHSHNKLCPHTSECESLCKPGITDSSEPVVSQAVWKRRELTCTAKTKGKDGG